MEEEEEEGRKSPPKNQEEKPQGGGGGGWGSWGISSFSMFSDLQKAAEDISRNVRDLLLFLIRLLCLLLHLKLGRQMCEEIW